MECFLKAFVFGKEEHGFGNGFEQIGEMEMKKLMGLPVHIGLVGPSVPGQEIHLISDELNQAAQFVFQLTGPALAESNRLTDSSWRLYQN